MSTTASTITIIATVILLVTGIVTAQGYWITREIDKLDKRIDRLADEISGLASEMRQGFARVEAKLTDHETRISRLEGPTPAGRV